MKVIELMRVIGEWCLVPISRIAMGDAVYGNLYVNGKERVVWMSGSNQVSITYIYTSAIFICHYPLTARLVKENWHRRVQQGSDERLGQPRNRTSATNCFGYRAMAYIDAQTRSTQ
jgi:hypothetical protein